MTEKNYGICTSCKSQFVKDQPFLRLGRMTFYAGKKGSSQQLNEIKILSEREFSCEKCVLDFVKEIIAGFNYDFYYSDSVFITSDTPHMGSAEIILSPK